MWARDSSTIADVYAVALVALGTSVEAEAPSFAEELGLDPYGATQVLRRQLPTVVLRTPDRDVASKQLERLVRRGHSAVGFSLDAVVASAAMGEVRSFVLEDGAVRFQLRGRQDELVPFDAFLCFVRAVHRSTEKITTVTKERAFDIKKFAVSGGVLMTKTVEKEKVSQVEEREAVVYLFRRGSAPLLFGATRAKYMGLGAEVRPTQLENFERTLTLLRERAPFAPYDTRLVGVRAPSEVKMGLGRGQESTSSADGIDLLAHVVAMTLARASANPYRER